MIPLRDNIPSRTTPWVNYGVIAVCSLVFLQQYLTGLDSPTLVEKYGMIPARVSHPDAPVMVKDIRQTPVGPVEQLRPAAKSPIPPLLTMLTCIFLHGGWFHIIGNMWFLFVFGDNVEDRLGHVGYLIFYLGCGVMASLSHFWSSPESTVPTIGASGAIAGVMGAYLVFYPKAKVLSLIPIFILFYFIVLPAPIFLGIWFLIQLLEGTTVTDVASGGVAWWAHIGGFVIGGAVAGGLNLIGLAKPPVTAIRPGMDHDGVYHRPNRF